MNATNPSGERKFWNLTFNSPKGVKYFTANRMKYPKFLLWSTQTNGVVFPLGKKVIQRVFSSLALQQRCNDHALWLKMVRE